MLERGIDRVICVLKRCRDKDRVMSELESGRDRVISSARVLVHSNRDCQPFIILYFFLIIYMFSLWVVCTLFLRTWKLGFPDIETNPGPRGPVLSFCRILSSNDQSLYWKISDLTEASCQYNVLLYFETFVYILFCRART